MSTEPLSENEIQEFVYWMENSAPALVDSTANGLVDYSIFSQSRHNFDILPTQFHQLDEIADSLDLL